MTHFKYFLSIAIAAGAGYAIGLLTAPKKGKHMRSMIMNELDSTKDDLEEAASQKLHEAKKILKKAVENKQESGKKALNKIKESMHM